MNLRPHKITSGLRIVTENGTTALQSLHHLSHTAISYLKRPLQTAVSLKLLDTARIFF